jgi:hypothetical protein
MFENIIFEKLNTAHVINYDNIIIIRADSNIPVLNIILESLVTKKILSWYAIIYNGKNDYRIFAKYGYGVLNRVYELFDYRDKLSEDKVSHFKFVALYVADINDQGRLSIRDNVWKPNNEPSYSFDIKSEVIFIDPLETDSKHTETYLLESGLVSPNTIDKFVKGIHISESNDVSFNIEDTISYEGLVDNTDKMREFLLNGNLSLLEDRLFYLFAIIATIEAKYKNTDTRIRDIYVKDSIADEKYQEMMRIRSYAISDFKFFLSKLEKQISDYDFLQNFKQSFVYDSIYIVKQDKDNYFVNLFQTILYW